MLTLYADLFRRLNQEIPYTVWKACHELPLAVNGHDDIDILVDAKCRKNFQDVMLDYGFLHAEFSSLKFPFVEHYYGFDKESGKFCHLHVYFKIVTGESHLKSYHIPIEKEVLAHRFLDSLDVYEASYEDQALLYSMRHYMKRASIIGFLFWTYERQGYSEEYEYIRNNLNLTDSQHFNPNDYGFFPRLDFGRLDMGRGIAGYYTARNMISGSSVIRRFSPWGAVYGGIRNLVLRLLYKALRTRKHLDCGLVLALSGIDGSGKSTMVEELAVWLGRHFSVREFHLGKPSPTGLTVAIRPLLFLYRAAAHINRSGVENKAPQSSDAGLKRRNGIFWGVRYLSLAYERNKLAHRARGLAKRGRIIVCDRYPSRSHGKMDSPCIEFGGSRLVETMKRYEAQFYERIPKADVVIVLNVSVEEAIERNKRRVKRGKEGDAEIVLRHKENQGLDYSAHKVFIIDANLSYGNVLQSLKSLVWECLTAADRELQTSAHK